MRRVVLVDWKARGYCIKPQHVCVTQRVDGDESSEQLESYYTSDELHKVIRDAPNHIVTELS